MCRIKDITWEMKVPRSCQSSGGDWHVSRYIILQLADNAEYEQCRNVEQKRIQPASSEGSAGTSSMGRLSILWNKCKLTPICYPPQNWEEYHKTVTPAGDWLPKFRRKRGPVHYIVSCQLLVTKSFVVCSDEAAVRVRTVTLCKGNMEPAEKRWLLLTSPSMSSTWSVPLFITSSL